MTEFQIGILWTSGLLAMVFLGVRVFAAAAIVGLLGTVHIIGWDAGAGIVGTVPHSKSVNYALSVLPMFILIGFIAYHAGLTHALFEAAKAWFGWVPGGLAVASVFATAGFAAVSGASTATAAVFSRVAIPTMLENNYSPKLAAGVVAAGGTLASLIPPSAILVIYAIIVEESVGALIIAGFIPGIISAIIYAMLIIGQCMVKPDMGRPIEFPGVVKSLKTLPGTLPIFFVVGVIFWAMYTGKATPTEAGALGAFIVLCVAVFHGMKWENLEDALLEPDAWSLGAELEEESESELLESADELLEPEDACFSSLFRFTAETSSGAAAAITGADVISPPPGLPQRPRRGPRPGAPPRSTFPPPPRRSEGPSASQRRARNHHTCAVCCEGPAWHSAITPLVSSSDPDSVGSPR